MDREEIIKSKTDMLHINLNDLQIKQFVTYYDMLIEKNKVMNLTRVTSFEDVVDKHFVDSLSIVNVMDLNRDMTVIDVGTGAGFPGIPLKIAFPQLKITLLDSLDKRTGFLNEVISALGLKDIAACHGRAEDYGHFDDYRERYDLCVSRAVAELNVLCEYCVPFVRIGGYFVAYKTDNVLEEIGNAKNALRIMGAVTDNVCGFDLPGTDISRSLAVFRKISSSGLRYPRKAGKPSGRPL